MFTYHFQMSLFGRMSKKYSISTPNNQEYIVSNRKVYIIETKWLGK